MITFILTISIFFAVCYLDGLITLRNARLNNPNARKEDFAIKWENYAMMKKRVKSPEVLEEYRKLNKRLLIYFIATMIFIFFFV